MPEDIETKHTFNLPDVKRKSLPRKHNVIEQLIKEVKKHPALSKNEEYALFKRFKEQADEEARQKIILSTLYLLLKLAGQYKNKGVSFMELVAAGYEGLIKAFDNFEPSKNVKFSTYAHWWIRYFMLKALAEKNIIKIPHYLIKTARDVRKNYMRIASNLGRNPTIEEMAKALGTSPADIQLAFQLPDSISLSRESENGIFFSEIIPDETSLSPEEVSDREGIKDRLATVLKDRLLLRERLIISRIYGFLFPDRRLTLEEIAEIFKSPPGDVRRKLKQILSYYNINLYDIDAIRDFAVSPEMDKLSILERELIFLYSGIAPDEEYTLTLAEVGKILGITKEGVRQIKNKALSKLKTGIRLAEIPTFFRR